MLVLVCAEVEKIDQCAALSFPLEESYAMFFVGMLRDLVHNGNSEQLAILTVGEDAVNNTNS